MDYSEIEKYKVAVSVSDNELVASQLTVDDLLERNSKGWDFLRKLKAGAIEFTGYEWPGCAYSMEMKVVPQKGILRKVFRKLEDRN